MTTSFLAHDVIVLKKGGKETPAGADDEGAVDAAVIDPRADPDATVRAADDEPFLERFEPKTEVEKRVLRLRTSEGFYERLARSIAPEIYGHTDVKKALLLTLVGGSPPPGNKSVRGNIHVLLMGDPGVAKSQLLKHLVTLSPRGVYASGKETSGARLTAAITRDAVSREPQLEGGSLVLADRGICAIDEFDKMAESDQANIYEAMESQSVSISKAGITTSMNTRCAVIAAANPKWGMYQVDRTPIENMNLPSALLSRFDVRFCMLDRADEEHDRRLVDHIVSVHSGQHATAASAGEERIVDGALLRDYIKSARRFRPVIPRAVSAQEAERMTPEERRRHSLADTIINKYEQLRGVERVAPSDRRRDVTTPRTLLALIRLTQAHAKLRLSSERNEEDFHEACRIMEEAKNSVLPDRPRMETEQGRWAAAYREIERFLMHNTLGGFVSLNEIRNVVPPRGFSRAEVDDSLEVHERLGFLVFSEDRQSVKLMGT